MSFIAYEQYDKKTNTTTQGYWCGDGTILISQTQGHWDSFWAERKKLNLDDAYEKGPSWHDLPHESISLVPSELEGIMRHAYYEPDDGMVFEEVMWENRPGWFSPASQVLAFRNGDTLEVRQRSSIKWSKCKYDTKMVDGQLDMRAIPGTIREWHRDDLFAEEPKSITLRLGEWHMLALGVLKMGGLKTDRIEHLKFPPLEGVEITHHGFVLNMHLINDSFFTKIDLDKPLEADLLPMNCIS